jgi:small GTP-binding protein
MNDSIRRDLRALLADGLEAVVEPTLSQSRLLSHLRALGQRLEEEHFQLAVLGQFNRGKSTLLNALLGHPLLPMAITPLTAIPTFIRNGVTPDLTITYKSGRRDRTEAAQIADLGPHLAQTVAEGANTLHAQGVARVDVTIPLLLSGGVTLIDTPGIGSTQRHNTETAESVLPECDGALLVISVDPPITEAEIDYLSRIRATVAHVIVVMNKIDTVDAADHAAAVTFVREVLVDRGGFTQAPTIFSVSAKNALRAKLANDSCLLAASGLPDLEVYLGDLLVREKIAILRKAAKEKARHIVSDLRVETNMRLNALLLPLDELGAKIAIFKRSVTAFEHEKQRLQDLLTGDWARALRTMESACEELYQTAKRDLRQALASRIADAATNDAARAIVEQAVAAYFDKELRDVAVSISERIDAAVNSHQSRAEELLDLVRKTAAGLMQVPLRDRIPNETFRSVREPYWVTSGHVDSLQSLTADGLARLLPASYRARRNRQRLLKGIDTVVLRNVGNLQWAMRQNVDDTFRRLGPLLDQRFTESIAATSEIMRIASDRKRQHDAALREEIEILRKSAGNLAAIEEELTKLPDLTSHD